MHAQLFWNKPTSPHPEAAAAGQRFLCYHMKHEKRLGFRAESTIDALAVGVNRPQEAADWKNRAVCWTFLLSAAADGGKLLRLQTHSLESLRT